MASDLLRVALIHEVFHDAAAPESLRERLAQARGQAAELALLPELPLDPWIPATRTPREADAEEPGGRRHAALAAAARHAGLTLVGGAIVREPGSGARFNRALLFDAQGELAASYDKLHIPSEEGYWESDHYAPGLDAPRRIDAVGMPLGLQICSDVNRPQGCHLLAAQGVEAILVPRATPPETYERWLTVMRAAAITCATYVVSVNRPRPEGSAQIGGPSVAIGPDGAVLAESTSPVVVVALDRSAVSAARRDYPGYLDVRCELYGRAWTALHRGR